MDPNPNLGPTIGKKIPMLSRHTPRMRIFKKEIPSVSTQAASMGENSPPTQSKKTDSFLLRQSVLTAKRFLGIEYLLDSLWKALPSFVAFT